MQGKRFLLGPRPEICSARAGEDQQRSTAELGRSQCEGCSRSLSSTINIVDENFSPMGEVEKAGAEDDGIGKGTLPPAKAQCFRDRCISLSCRSRATASTAAAATPKSEVKSDGKTLTIAERWESCNFDPIKTPMTRATSLISRRS